jgi:adenine deaminase
MPMFISREACFTPPSLPAMALLVIPHLKMSDKGLFDADRFLPTNLFE